MQLQALWTAMPATRERQLLLGIIGDAGRCGREARQSLWGLRTGASAHTDFAEKLEQVARQTVGTDGPSITLQLQPLSIRESPEVEYQLLYIVREALANTLAHAHARTVDVTLQVDGSNLWLQVKDDGIGFSKEAGSFGHFGLIGMQERAATIGAALTITSQPGQGTSVSISLVLANYSESSGRPKEAPSGNTNASAAVVHHK